MAEKSKTDAAPRSATQPPSRRLGWVVGVLGGGAFLFISPPFHIVPLQAAQEKTAAALFDAVAYTDTFWNGPLKKAGEQATDAAELLAALKQDPAAAAKRFGHRLGLGSDAAFYFISGQGRIVSVEKSAIGIALGDGTEAQVVIELGPVFGNAIRDGSGLLNVSDFANGQDFNAISAELNRRVEEQVLPLLKTKATPEKRVRFVGAVALTDSAEAPASLTVVPIAVEFL